MAGKNDEPEVTDVRALLAQKEKDLILAAELGKALLEKNEDLSQQNEKMTEEFSKQLEVRRKLIWFHCERAHFIWLLYCKLHMYSILDVNLKIGSEITFQAC